MSDKKVSVSRKKLEKIMDTQFVEKQIADYLQYIDVHLFLFSLCDCDEDKKLQTEQLNRLRKKLYELEYFSFF
jgi:hypothetical protein